MKESTKDWLVVVVLGIIYFTTLGFLPMAVSYRLCMDTKSQGNILPPVERMETPFSYQYDTNHHYGYWFVGTNPVYTLNRPVVTCAEGYWRIDFVPEK